MWHKIRTPFNTPNTFEPILLLSSDAIKDKVSKSQNVQLITDIIRDVINSKNPIEEFRSIMDSLLDVGMPPCSIKQLEQKLVRNDLDFDVLASDVRVQQVANSLVSLRLIKGMLFATI